MNGNSDGRDRSLLHGGHRHADDGQPVAEYLNVTGDVKFGGELDHGADHRRNDPGHGELLPDRRGEQLCAERVPTTVSFVGSALGRNWISIVSSSASTFQNFQGPTTPAMAW